MDVKKISSRCICDIRFDESLPSDKCQAKKVSTVPNLKFPACALALAPSTLSKIQEIFVAEK